MFLNNEVKFIPKDPGKALLKFLWVYFIIAYVISGIIKLIINDKIQIFWAKSVIVSFNLGFFTFLIISLLCIYWGFKTGYKKRTQPFSRVHCYFIAIPPLFSQLFILFCAILIIWTNYEIAKNSFGKLAYLNSESPNRLAGIVINSREIIIPTLLFSFLTFKKKHSLFFNSQVILLIVVFCFSETFLRFTKSAILFSIINFFFSYLHKNRIKWKHILLILVLFLIYINSYDLLSGLRTFGVDGAQNLSDLNQIEQSNFADKIKQFSDRLVGFKDFYYIYNLLPDVFLPTSNPSNYSPSDLYTIDLLGVVPGTHGQATSLFGYALIKCGVLFAPFFLFSIAWLCARIMFKLDQNNNRCFAAIIFFIIFDDVFSTFTDGSIKLLIFNTTILLRILGSVVFYIAYTRLLNKYSLSLVSTKN